MKKMCFLVLLLVLAGCSNEAGKSSTSVEQTAEVDRTREIDGSKKETQTAGTDIEKQKDTGTSEPGVDKVQSTDSAIQTAQAKELSTAGNTAITNIPALPPAKHGSTSGESSIGSDNNNSNPGPTPSGEEPKGPVAPFRPSTTAITEKGDEVLVYVGTFAQWKKSDGREYDGTYDPTHKLFVYCSSNRCHEVQESEITFPKFGRCDSALANRIKMFKIVKKNGTIELEGSSVKVIGTRGIIQRGNYQDAITLDQATLTRIRKATEGSTGTVNWPKVPQSPPEPQKGKVETPLPSVIIKDKEPKPDNKTIVISGASSPNTGKKIDPETPHPSVTTKVTKGDQKTNETMGKQSPKRENKEQETHAVGPTKPVVDSKPPPDVKVKGIEEHKLPATQPRQETFQQNKTTETRTQQQPAKDKISDPAKPFKPRSAQESKPEAKKGR